MKIETIPLTAIRENGYNPNHMAPELFESLVNSIRDHGFVQPIVVRKAGDGYEIVDGAHRYRALRRLGRADADCVVVEDDREMARLRTLVMNRLRGRMDNFGVAKILKNYRPGVIERYLAYEEKHRLELRELLVRVPKVRLSSVDVRPLPVVVEFLVSRGDASKVEKALRATGAESRNEALLIVCSSYAEERRRGRDAKSTGGEGGPE